MRLRHIEVFHAVFSSGSVSSAAKILNVSQPSVSKVLHHAEDQLGYKLFERIKGKLVPTQEAHVLFNEVSKVNSSIEQLRRLSENLGNKKKGNIRIASTPALSLQILPIAMAEFSKSHPDILFDIETLHYHEIITALSEQRTDIGLVFEPFDRPGIRSQVLGHGEFVCVAPKKYALPQKESLSLDDLQNYDIIRLNSKGPLGRLFTARLGTFPSELNVIATVETYSVARSMAELGMGVAIIDELTAKAGDKHPDTTLYRLTPRLAYTFGAISFESAPLSLSAKAFLQTLERVIHQYLAGK